MNIMKRKKNNLARAAMMLLFAVLGSVGVWAQTTTFTYSASEQVTKFDTYANFTGATAVSSHTFANGTGTVVYAGTVTGLGTRALNDTKLTAIEIPASVEIIGSSAFYGCEELATITFAEGSKLTTIEGSAFWDCKKLTSIDLPETLTTLGHKEKNYMDEEVEQGSVFSNCGLTSLHFPKSLTKIYGGGHVANCPLTSLTIEYGGWPYESPTGSNAIVAQNNRSLVIGCAATKNLSNLQFVGAEAFWGENQPFSLTLPYNVIQIGKRAFHLAKGLTRINIPINTSSIEEDCFSGTSLTTINLHDGVTEIKKQAFTDCENLKTVYLGRYTKKIEENAFAMCSNVTDVYCSGKPDNLTWDGKGFAATTVFHVTDAAAWQAKFPNATAKFETYAPDEDFITVGIPSYAMQYPVGAYKNYTLAQMVYTAEDIYHAAGTITSLGFNTINGGVSRNLSIYITKTNNNYTDSYVPVTDADLVFSGEVNFKYAQWNTIDFDKPYQYDGTSNLMVTICDNTGKSDGWGALTNYVTSNSKCLYLESDDQAFDATASNEKLEFESLSYKAQIQLCFEVNPKPYNAKVLEVGDVSALVQCSLRDGADKWNLRYREAVAEGEQENEWTVVNNITERSKTIEGLTAATKYEAQLQAVYGEGVLSVWTSSIPFTTNCCPVEQQAEIRYVLNGSNRVWKNFAVQILDITEEENPVEVAYLNPPGDDVFEGYLTLCCSHKYKVNWIYDENNPDFNQYYSVALYYDNADLIYRMATGDAPEEDVELTTFVVDCGDYCTQMPKNLSIDDISHDNITISFTSTTAGGKIAYSTEADFNPATATNTQSVNFVPDGDSGSGNSYSYKLTGLEPVTDYYVAVQSLCSAQLLDDGGKSRWTKPVKVKTGPEEAPVDNITVVNDGSSKSKVSWTPKGLETKHNVYIRQQTGTGTPVDASQIQKFNLTKEDGATYSNWGGGNYNSYATSEETNKWLVVTKVPANAVVKAKTDEGDTYTKKKNTKGVTTEVYSVGAEKQENDGSDVEALKDEIQSKIVNLKKMRDDGKKLSKKQWKERYRLYKKAQLDWDDAEEGSAEEKALEEQMKSLKRELGLDKRNVKKAVKRGINSGYKAYKKARKSRKNRAADTEEYFVWFNHEDGVGYFSISELEIVTEENWGEWTSYTDVTGNSYDFENLTPGTTYEVMIEPVYEDGTTGPEDVFLFTTFGTEADPVEGEFSVSEGKKVQFAKGNLQYSRDYNWDDHWKLAEHQYDILGLNNLETQELNEYGNRFTSTDHLDLFCWSAGRSNKGTDHTYPDDSYYTGDFVEWGTLPEFTSIYGQGWQTLSKDEWTYLLTGRENADKLKALATISYMNGEESAEVKGLILLPDNWTGGAPATTYTAETWATLETAGAVFLPATGTLTVSFENHTVATVNGLADGIGSYWSSTPSETDINAFATTFNATEVKPAEDIYRRIGSAVRLVKCTELTVTTANSGFTTLVSTETLDFTSDEGPTAYIATSVDNTENTITLKRIGVVPANTPIVLKGEPSTTYTVKTTATTAASPKENLLRGSATKSIELEANTAYILSGGKFHKNNKGTQPAGKAYLPADVVNSASAPQLIIVFDDNGNMTAIKDVRGKVENVRNQVWYDLSGRKLNGMPSKKGLYIINGKKVVIK